MELERELELELEHLHCRRWHIKMEGHSSMHQEGFLGAIFFSVVDFYHCPWYGWMS